MLFIVFAALIAAVAAADVEDDLVLLQTRVEKLDGEPAHSTGSEAYEALGSHLRAFESSVRKTSEHQQADLRTHKVQYAVELAKQQKANTGVAARISTLRQEIEHLQNTNSKMRQNAVRIQKDNHGMIDELRHLEAQVDLAEEFIDNALQSDTEDAEVSVLKELDNEDKAHSDSDEHRRRLEEVTGKTHAALLETPHAETLDILRSLEGRLTDLVDEHSAAEASMKAHFDSKMLQLTGQHSELISELAELESVKAARVELSDRLNTAVQHVSHKNADLSKKVSSLKSFVRNLGDDHSDSHTPVSLLQRGSKPISLLHSAPDPDTSLRRIGSDMSVQLVEPAKPAVSKNLSSQIRALQQTVEAKQQQTDAELATQKAAYEAKLKSQHIENAKAETDNTKLATAISKLNYDNDALQEQAAEITEVNHRLRAEIHNLQSNFTYADEFAARMLKDFKSATASSTLDVLDELKEESVTRTQEQAHSQRLQEIVMKTSLLQDAAVRSEKPVADESTQLTQMLQTSLEAMSSEASERAATLKEEFDGKFSAGDKRHEELMTKQVTLTEDKETLTKLKASLKTAVDYLAAEQAKLEAGVQSLKGFSSHMSSA